MSKKILVVDDEDDIRELCRVNLEFEGFQVFDAPNGPAGLELAARERIGRASCRERVFGYV